MQETGIWSLGGEDPLEEEMAASSSILACKFPWTEEPDGLQSMGSQRVEHDWACRESSNRRLVSRPPMGSISVVQLLRHDCLPCNPMDYSPPGSPVHGIIQAWILEWVAISFSISQTSHGFYLWDTYKPSGSGAGKISTSPPETWDSHWSQSYKQIFEVGNRISFDAYLLTLGKSWSLSFSLSLFSLPPTPTPTSVLLTVCVWHWTCSLPNILAFIFGTDQGTKETNRKGCDLKNVLCLPCSWEYLCHWSFQEK